MKDSIKELIPYLIIVIVVVFIRSYIITPVIVSGDSMDETLENGQVLFLSKISYHIHDIKRFDIIVIRDIDNDLIIKRVIGKPGDYIEYKNNSLYINNKKVKDIYGNGKTTDFTLEEICKITGEDCKGKIPKDKYLALGDNREVSSDSRIKGLFDKDQILGKATLRIWPLDRISIVN